MTNETSLIIGMAFTAMMSLIGYAISLAPNMYQTKLATAQPETKTVKYRWLFLLMNLTVVCSALFGMFVQVATYQVSSRWLVFVACLQTFFLTRAALKFWTLVRQ